MKCPICSEEMVAGTAFLEKSTWNAVAFGFGTRELQFRREVDGRKLEVLNAWNTSAAYRCIGCGALLLAGRRES